MLRRNFIKNTATLAAVSCIPLGVQSCIKEKKYKMGLQLFTIRDAMAKDPIATLKQVKALGYQDLEHFGYDGLKHTYYGIPATEFATILNDLDLTITSGHYPFSDYFNKSNDDLKRFTDQCIKGAHAVNSPYITWPWLAPEYRTIDNFKKLASLLNTIGAQVSGGGLTLAYHNHDFEFTDHNGEIGYDIILKETDPELVKLQMDMYWVKHSSKQSPSQLIAQNRGRYVMWHIKDMDKVTRDYSELGNGSIDYVSMLSTINKTDLDYYYIEQGGNFAVNSMQSIADSAAYFKANLQQYL